MRTTSLVKDQNIVKFNQYVLQYLSKLAILEVSIHITVIWPTKADLGFQSEYLKRSYGTQCFLGDG